MKALYGIFAVVLISITASSQAEEILKGKVTNVIDGNTFELLAEDNESYKVVLYGVDSPELGQEYGDKAKKLLEKLILNKNITTKIQGKDRLGNRLGITLLDEKTDPRIELLEAGLAWTSERNALEELESVKEKAKEKGKGLWKESEPTPPWIYRRQQSMLQIKSS
jgi:endonuclease YncB( thermonuclease family)